MSIKLVAMDLDATLLNDELEIPEDAKQAIRRAVEHGVMVTLASGRMYRSVIPFAEELGLDVPLITYDGALIRSSRSGEVYHYLPVPLDLAKEVLAYARANHLHVNVYVDDEIYVEKLDPEIEAYSRRIGVPPHLVDDLSSFLAQDPAKLLLIMDESIIEGHLDALKAKFHGRLHVVRSMPTYIELKNKGASKGSALSALAERLGILPREVMAIGDSDNDIPMLEYAGIGVAVANARQSVRERADYVTAEENGKGVAEAIRKFVLEACGTPSGML